ncbi:MAG: Nif11-like leader peptide family natural product precursor [Methylococcus sp.]|nr:Nif11-like leader peptide family natural product precursor [Methylococcus sp.]
MSVESAIAYIKRMRSDEAFRREVNDCVDESENWRRLKQLGYEFTMEDFRQAKDAIYVEHGIVPQF